MVLTQWYIDGVPADLAEGPYMVELPPEAPNNLTVRSFFSFREVPVSCRIPFYPNVDLGVFQLGECLVRDVYVHECRLIPCDLIGCLCVLLNKDIKFLVCIFCHFNNTILVQIK